MRRQLRGVLRRPPQPVVPPGAAPRAAVRALLAEGGSQALVQHVRDMVALPPRDYDAVARLAAAAEKVGRLDTARAMRVVAAVQRGRLAEAAPEIAAMAPHAVTALVAGEAVMVRYAEDPAAARAFAAELVATRATSATALLGVARAAFLHDDLDLARQALQRIHRRRRRSPWPVVDEAQWLRRWVDGEFRRPPAAPVPPGTAALAVLDYKQPDLNQVSANIGDYVQTLASLGHLVRLPGLRFRGDQELAELAAELQAQVPVAHRGPTVERDVALVRVNRDASSLDSVPPGTWMLAFGWYMHSWWRQKWDFPFHPNLRPVFVSFHLNKRSVIRPAGLDYLRANGPVGCRDWHTVSTLLDAGVPAFFSGCITSTVGTVFPPAPPPPAGAPVAAVDLDPQTVGDTAQPLQHSRIGVRGMTAPVALRRAVEILDSYRRDYSAVVTSRLHCYLPARALGVEVTFRPANPADIRFDGLVGLDDAEFAAMQDRLRGWLEPLLLAILRGEDEHAVRAVWARVTTDAVEQAQQRLAAAGR